MKVYNPNAIGVTTGFGVPTGGTSGQILQKVDVTDYNTQWTTVPQIVDNSSSNYIDIGEVRYQWGYQAGGANARTVTFPAAFRDTTYSFTANVEFADYGGRGVNLDAKTTTNILCRVTAGGNGSGAPFNWMAIGLKPE